MDKQQGRSVRRTRRRTEGVNTHRLTQSNTQKVPNWKTPGHDDIHGYWFKNSLPSMTDSLSE